jgi:hypothetical protein
MTMRPESGISTPAIMRKVVDLPQPEGPRRQVTCPAAISSETAFTTALPPKLRVKDCT